MLHYNKQKREANKFVSPYIYVLADDYRDRRIHARHMLELERSSEPKNEANKMSNLYLMKFPCLRYILRKTLKINAVSDSATFYASHRPRHRRVSHSTLPTDRDIVG
jgi:hypothetical protein